MIRLMKLAESLTTKGGLVQKFAFVLLACLIPASPQATPRNALGAVKLLPGYHIVIEPGLDVVAWTIEKPEGLIIHFEAGMSEGLAVNSKDKSEYEWQREQFLNGRKVLVALAKPGAKIYPDLDKERDLPQGKILLISFPLSGHADHAANFIGKIANSEELADMLLTALSFDPDKGIF